MQCPKCGSENVLIQREQTGHIGGSMHSAGIKGSHGVMYWLFVGWWAWIFKLMWEMIKICCTCGLSLFFRKKKDGLQGKSMSAEKTFNKTIAVCQECGNHWQV